MTIPQHGKILVISHGYRLGGGGPAQDIRDYLKDKVEQLDYLVHPFPHADFRASFLDTFINGSLKKNTKFYAISGPEWFRYLQQILTTTYFLLSSRKRYDVCFALDDHAALSVLLFRKLRLVKKLVYYAIDYTPQRFPDPIMNSLYHFADRVASTHSDMNWVVAKPMIGAKGKNGVNLKRCSPFLEVPMGSHQKEIKLQPSDKINPYRLVYMGTILEKQGLQLAIESLPVLLNEFPAIHLTIIGTGDYESRIRSMVKEFKIQTVIAFSGYMSNMREIESTLTKEAIGLAPYKPIPGSFSYYADPSKIKIYLGCGLPVITTDVTAFSKVLRRAKAGVVIDYTVESFCNAVRPLLKDRQQYQKYRESAIKLSKDYDTEKILQKAIKQL